MNVNDMIVNLKNVSFQEDEGSAVRIKRAFAGDKERILQFVRENFNTNWIWETEYAILQSPGQCFVATEHGKILGFACYDSSAKGFFGPIGVLEEERGRQIGTRLLLKTLDAMKAAGYWYAIIGWVDDAAPFYQKTVNARFIEDACPENSVYSNMVFMD